MNGIVASTITSENTGIFCVVMIYFEKPDGAPPRPRWRRLFGTLFEKCVIAGDVRYGNVGHWTNGGGKLAVVGEVPGFAMPAMPALPVILPDFVETLTIAELYDVPADFLESVTAENPLSGGGRLLATQEQLKWTMWRGSN
jgi:hypothetical protein